MSDMMDDIRAAAAEVPSEPASAPEAPAVAPSEAAPAPTTTRPEAAGRQRDDVGRFAPKPKDEPTEAVKPAEPKPEGQPEAAKPEAEAKPPEAPQPTHKPPQSWKPTAREKWAALPAEVQAEVARLDGETQRVLRESAESRKLAEGFEKTLAPYRGLLTGPPLQVVDGLLRTAAQLQTAPPAHKAALVANIISSYGVSVDAIADALEGKQAAPGAQQQHGEYRDPRVDQLLQRFQQAEQQQRQRLTSTAQQELEAFQAKAEFLEDVRDTVADMMEVAAKRGISLTLEDAYNRAVALHPEVSRVVEQRKAANAATASTVATQQARRAASSVRSEPAPVAAPSGKGRPLDDVMAAAQSLSGR